VKTQSTVVPALISFMATPVCLGATYKILKAPNAVVAALMMYTGAFLLGCVLGWWLGRNAVFAVALGAIAVSLAFGVMFLFIVSPLAFFVVPFLLLYGICVGIGAAVGANAKTHFGAVA
jgi:hypothetical protein